MWVEGDIGSNESEKIAVVWPREEKKVGKCPIESTQLTSEGRRPRGRPKKSWMNVISKDMRKLGINENLTSDRYG